MHSLTKVGNSMAVILPKALRESAQFNASSSLRMASPRPGVVVITAIDGNENRLERFQQAESFFESLKNKAPAWPKGKSAEDLINDVKGERADEIVSL